MVWNKAYVIQLDILEAVAETDICFLIVAYRSNPNIEHWKVFCLCLLPVENQPHVYNRVGLCTRGTDVGEIQELTGTELRTEEITIV
jgi:hypothetical protein